MLLPPDWPAELGKRLLSLVGTVTACQQLSGLSGRGVFRVSGVDRDVVVKGRASAQEVHFYRTVAPQLPGIATPEVFALVEERGDCWLVLEHIPHALPRERWLADAGTMGYLAALHTARPVLPAAAPLFQPGWTSAMTGEALNWFPRSRLPIEQVLSRWQQEFHVLNQPVCPVSGDPNPRNWGLRAGGALILFDWERFGWGQPALDLAITVPGLGDPDTFERVADAYLLAGGASQPGLPRATALAKAWTLVEFLVRSNFSPERSELAQHIARHFPDWLSQFEH